MLALERSERTRTRTETQREEVGQPHTQSFGHKDAPCKLQVWTVTLRLRRVSHETPAQEKDPEDPSMDCKPSGVRRKASRHELRHEGDMGRGTPATPWAQ